MIDFLPVTMKMLFLLGPFPTRRDVCHDDWALGFPEDGLPSRLVRGAPPWRRRCLRGSRGCGAGLRQRSGVRWAELWWARGLLVKWVKLVIEMRTNYRISWWLNGISWWLNGISWWLNGISWWLNGISWWLNGISWWLNGISWWLNGISWWLNGISWWLNGISWWLNRFSWWLNGISWWLNGISWWLNGISWWLNDDWWDI